MYEYSAAKEGFTLEVDRDNEHDNEESGTLLLELKMSPIDIIIYQAHHDTISQRTQRVGHLF